MPPKAPVKGKQSVSTGADMPRRRTTRIREGDDMTDLGDGTDADDWSQAKTLEKPSDQLQLSEQDLKEEFTRILTANNPHAPQNIVRYSFKEKQYKQTSSVDQLAIHFSLDGNMLHKESDEAKRQKGKLGLAEASSEQAVSEAGEGAGAAAEEGEGDKQEAAEERADDAATPAPTDKRKLTNQFNYSERASQTYNNPYRERGTATEPPPRATFAGNVTQWEIYDAYLEDFEKQEKSKEKKTIPGRKEEEKTRKKLTITETQSDDISRVSSASKIVERMVNQNTYDDVAQDFRYWEDVSDDYRDQEGTLLPLWRFSHDKAKKLAVSSLCWNPKYNDLFAASFGSYDFMKQGTGLILFNSLKNPSYPEHVFETDSGVMCLDVHPEHPYQIAAGFYDGSVAVFNAVEKKDGPVHRCTAKNGKHTDPVWQVRWQKDDSDNNMNFYSISSDGRIVHWTIVKNEMIYQDVIKLTIPDASAEGPDGIKVPTLGCGTAFDFHKQKDYLFLVGTEEGKVHVCSKAYTSHFIDSIDAHNMAVYKVAWNYFHSKLYITCSADWNVKIWEMGSKIDKNTDGTESSERKPLFSFDLNNSVGDVAWAPYSSTVFAAVTADGKVYVYDLNVNKYEPICEQMVAQKKKTKLTHIEFNPVHPIIIVGDDRGNVTSLKLSPNLRKVPKEKKGQPPMDASQKQQYELTKLEKILAMVREPTESNVAN
ncbi:dynein intermediate chain 2, ciliary isoform X2 [Patella vulgata]|uniref:dynein intermediate chain 2, ciliary isoform X2 n=1 Tax=Patella vulgata TaxID=6465 RepID=UPI00217FDA95|nr:dynein intermediate chain 2, ciliary isoform X2 [Patella vulgata]